MSITLTSRALNASLQQSLKPQLVLEIDGVATVYSAVIVKKFILIGESNLVIGQPLPGEADVWTIGGFSAVEDQSDLMDLGGTSTTIRQSLNLDKGTGETISSIQVKLVDKDNEITDLITPGNVVEDMLGRKCKLWLGFENTIFKQDFVIIFRGIVDDIESGPGNVIFDIAHPDQKKRTKFYTQATTQLDGAIGSGDTTITVDSTTDFIDPAVSTDSTIKFFFRVEDEIMQYTGVTAVTFTGVTRGVLGTTAAAHADDSDVQSIISLTGNSVDLALKLMISGGPADYDIDRSVTNFVNLTPTDALANSIFFRDINLEQENGVTVGDTCTTTGSAIGANNFSLRTITQVGTTDFGSFIVVDGAALVVEFDSAAVIDFQSRFNTLGIGMQMAPEEVDIVGHEQAQLQFLSGFDYDFTIEESELDGKQFLTDEIYNPASAFSIPRNARSSVGIHLPPIPTTIIKSITADNVKNADSLILKRSSNQNFFNGMVYQIDKQVGEDRFLTNVINFSSTSRDRIPVGNKTLVIKAQGMRSSLGGVSLATTAGNRRLDKFKFGAESIKEIKVNFKTGFNLDIGDIVELSFSDLKLSDIQSGTRNGDSRLMQITNRILNIATGDVSLELVDTNFDKDVRFGLIGLTSSVKSATTTSIIIEAPPFSEPFPGQEGLKWALAVGTEVTVRNADFSTSDTTLIDSVVGNTINLETALSFTPSAGDIIELGGYDNQTDAMKLRYVAMSDVTFADGNPQYSMI